MRVLVLGAGVVGTAAAYFLNEAGHEVTVVERQAGAGLETSFANGGIVGAYSSRPWAHPEVPRMLIKWFGREDAPYLFRLRPDLAQWRWAVSFLRHCTRAQFERSQQVSLRLSTYSYDCLKALREKEGIAYDQRAEGVLHLHRSEAELDASYKYETRMADSRFHPDRLDRDQMLEAEPALQQTADQFAGATFFANDESGDAHKFTSGLAAAAAANGVTFRFGETVRRLTGDRRRVTGAETDKGAIEADAVVMSLASYSPQFLKRLGRPRADLSAQGLFGDHPDDRLQRRADPRDPRRPPAHRDEPAGRPAPLRRHRRARRAQRDHPPRPGDGDAGRGDGGVPELRRPQQGRTVDRIQADDAGLPADHRQDAGFPGFTWTPATAAPAGPIRQAPAGSSPTSSRAASPVST